MRETILDLGKAKIGIEFTYPFHCDGCCTEISSDGIRRTRNNGGNEIAGRGASTTSTAVERSIGAVITRWVTRWPPDSIN
jgi:hypothetical protein